MRLPFLYALALLVASAVLPVSGQTIGTIQSLPAHDWVKSEMGFVIFFNRRSANDAASSEVDVYAKAGQPVVNFPLLSLVPEAVSVSTTDVSIVPQQAIAVSAVYDRGSGTPTASLLLRFDFRGRLLWALDLAPSRDVEALAEDDQGDTWTVTSGSGGEDPGTAPTVVEYDDAGKVIRELLPRATFPSDSRATQQNAQIGPVTAGFSSGIFWFWLPASQEMVSINATSGAVKKQRLDIPRPRGAQRSWPLAVARSASGKILAILGQSAQPRHLGYVWSPDAEVWSQFQPGPCAGDWFLGLDGGQQLYLQLHSGAVCAFKTQ